MSKSQSDTKQTNVSYFSVSCLRVLFFSILSLNLYPIYLAYKNWQAIEKADGNRKVFPFLRSWILGVIFIIPLLLNMRKNFKAHLKNLIPFYMAVVAYVTALYAGITVHLMMVMDFDFTLFKAFLALQILQDFLILPIQYTVNKYCREINPEHKIHKSFLIGEVVTLLLATALFGLSYTVTSKFPIREFYRNFDRQTRNIIINKYIFEYGYPEICDKYGFEMKNYQNTFKKVYQNELKFLDEKLKEKNITYEHALRLGGEHFTRIIDRQLTKDLQILSQEMFANTKSTKAQNMYRLCSFMDMSAELVIKTQLNLP